MVLERGDPLPHLKFIKPYTRVLDQSNGIEWSRRCVGATTNIALSLLDRHIEADRGDHLAIVWEGEDGTSRALDIESLRARSIASPRVCMRLGLSQATWLAFIWR
jgi:acetyl-CoA synthetase